MTNSTLLSVTAPRRRQIPCTREFSRFGAGCGQIYLFGQRLGQIFPARGAGEWPDQNRERATPSRELKQPNRELKQRIAAPLPINERRSMPCDCGKFSGVHGRHLPWQRRGWGPGQPVAAPRSGGQGVPVRFACSQFAARLSAVAVSLPWPGARRRVRPRARRPFSPSSPRRHRGRGRALRLADSYRKGGLSSIGGI